VIPRTQRLRHNGDRERLHAGCCPTLTCRAVLFDMDGTLVDSTTVVEQVWVNSQRATG